MGLGFHPFLCTLEGEEARCICWTVYFTFLIILTTFTRHYYYYNNNNGPQIHISRPTIHPTPLFL